MAIKLHSVQTLAQKATRADVYYRSKNPNRVPNPRWNFGGGGGGFQGSTSGYTSGSSNVIDKFPFATNANATDVGDLTVARNVGLGGQSSSASGYTSGGRSAPLTPATTNVIDKFPFASNANATDVGDLTQGRYAVSAQSSTASGYTCGGGNNPPFIYNINIIDKFPFASNANATDVGDLTQGRYGSTGQTSSTSGYASGGIAPTVNHVNTIDKFPFASNANATDVGDITVKRYLNAGQSSDVSGYTSGGYGTPLRVNVIDKFPFASDGNATDVGDLTGTRESAAGQSSAASGYTSGGYTISPANARINIIDKFPFSSDANATDVGDLTQARQGAAGQQI